MCHEALGKAPGRPGTCLIKATAPGAADLWVLYPSYLIWALSGLFLDLPAPRSGSSPHALLAGMALGAIPQQPLDGSGRGRARWKAGGRGYQAHQGAGKTVRNSLCYSRYKPRAPWATETGPLRPQFLSPALANYTPMYASSRAFERAPDDVVRSMGAGVMGDPPRQEDPHHFLPHISAIWRWISL